MRKKIYSDKDKKPEKIEQNKAKEIAGLVIYCLIVIAAMFLIIKYVGQRTVVMGHSMEPTLQDSDNLITDKITYRFRDPKRFDIIVFPFKDNRATLLIKRIVGMPGETVQVIDGNVYVNGYVLEDNYGNAVMTDPGLAADPVVLKEDEYFVLGDNRNNSTDSRFESVGNIHRSEIIGRAWLRAVSYTHLDVYKRQAMF